MNGADMNDSIEGWDEHRAMALLGAMSEVAARGEHDSDKAARLVESAGRYVFGIEMSGSDPVGAVDPATLAGILETDAQRSLAVEFLVLVPYCDPSVEGAEVDRVEDYASALGTHPQALEDLHRVRQGHIKRLFFDYTRRAAGAVKMKGDERGILRRTWDEIHQYVGDPKLTEQYLPLESYPEGSLGRTFFDFYRARGFALPGEKHSLGDEVVGHDCCHILSGFNTDGRGEINVAGFEAGMKSDGFGWELLMEVILDFQLGINFGLALVGYTSKTDELDPEQVMVGVRRGLDCTVDLMGPEWDFWADAEKQVTDLREQYAIKGVEAVLLDPPEHPATG